MTLAFIDWLFSFVFSFPLVFGMMSDFFLNCILVLWDDVIHCLPFSPVSYVETLSPRMMVFGGGSF